MSFPHIRSFKAIVAECEGCDHIVNHFGKRICNCHVYPETKWWFEVCPDATHVDQIIEEDPIKEP